MSIRRALDLSGAATVRRHDGRVLHARLVVAWERPTTGRLHDAATAGGGGPLELALIAALLLQDGVRAVRYRLQGRRDWWLVTQVDDDAPQVEHHRDRAAAADAGERLLLTAVAAGGRYLPHGA